MFWMDVGDFEFILGKISHLISPRQMSNFGGNLPIMPDERLALTLRLENLAMPALIIITTSACIQ